VAAGLYHVTLHHDEGVTSGAMVIDGFISGTDVLYDPALAEPAPVFVTAVTSFETVPGRAPGNITFSSGSAFTEYSVVGAPATDDAADGFIHTVDVAPTGAFGPVSFTHGSPIVFVKSPTSTADAPLSWMGVDTVGQNDFGMGPLDFEGTVEFTLVAAPQPVVGSIGAAAAAAGLGL